MSNLPKNPFKTDEQIIKKTLNDIRKERDLIASKLTDLPSSENSKGGYLTSIEMIGTKLGVKSSFQEKHEKSLIEGGAGKDTSVKGKLEELKNKIKELNNPKELHKLNERLKECQGLIKKISEEKDILKQQLAEVRNNFIADIVFLEPSIKRTSKVAQNAVDKTSDGIEKLAAKKVKLKKEIESLKSKNDSASELKKAKLEGSIVDINTTIKLHEILKDTASFSQAKEKFNTGVSQAENLIREIEKETKQIEQTLAQHKSRPRAQTAPEPQAWRKANSNTPTPPSKEALMGRNRSSSEPQPSITKKSDIKTSDLSNKRQAPTPPSFNKVDTVAESPAVYSQMPKIAAKGVNKGEGIMLTGMPPMPEHARRLAEANYPNAKLTEQTPEQRNSENIKTKNERSESNVKADQVTSKEASTMKVSEVNTQKKNEPQKEQSTARPRANSEPTSQKPDDNQQSRPRSQTAINKLLNTANKLKNKFDNFLNKAKEEKPQDDKDKSSSKPLTKPRGRTF
jgi:hypothetical protein